MTLLFALLLLSVLGVITLLVFRNWEERHGGSRAETGIRATTDATVVAISSRLKEFPRFIGGSLYAFLKQGVFYGSAAMLRLVQFTERKLIRVINLVRGKGDITTKKGSASFFLQNVATYKENPTTVETQ